MIFEMEECGGCRTCELACGYHQIGNFSPSHSSLHIIDRSDGKPGYLVEINNNSIEKTPLCDGCAGLEQPFCVAYCHRAEILAAMIQAVMEQTDEQK